MENSTKLETLHLAFQGLQVRAVVLDNEEVLFLAHDVLVNVIGVANTHSLTTAIDSRCKESIVMSFDFNLNPQRYNFIDIDGLMCAVYRARKCRVDRLDFINWAKEKAGV